MMRFIREFFAYIISALGTFAVAYFSGPVGAALIRSAYDRYYQLTFGTHSSLDVSYHREMGFYSEFGVRWGTTLIAALTAPIITRLALFLIRPTAPLSPLPLAREVSVPASEKKPEEAPAAEEKPEEMPSSPNVNLGVYGLWANLNKPADQSKQDSARRRNLMKEKP